jgi:hypothetical protein
MAVAAVALLVGAAVWVWIGSVAGGPRQTSPPRVRAELRSWVVAGRGRHLYLEILPVNSAGAGGERVEFTAAMLRRDYRYTRDRGGSPRVARMRGGPLNPPAFCGPPDNRLEATYELTPEQARCLARDRLFSTPYALLGANSNAGLRRVMSECGCALPPHVLAGGGWLGEFPGIDADVGEDVPETRWGEFGIERSAR